MSVRMIKDVLLMRDIKGHCPLCGRDKAKASHTDEHIFPLWLQHHHNLLNCRLTIPNLIDRKYKAVKIGICARCNNKTFSRLEGRISRALTSSHPFLEANGLDRDDVAAWIGKIIWLLARKSHFDRDPRKRHKAKPEGVLPSVLLSRLLYAGMFVRCLSRGKKMLACHADQHVPVRVFGPPYSLYVHEIDLRDERFGSFDFMDNPVSGGAAIRSGNVGMICLFDGGVHRSFLSARYAYLDGHALHPMQFNELAARIFYDQTLLDPRSGRATFYWNKSHNVIFAETSGNPDIGPYRRDLHDPVFLASMLGYYQCEEPDDLLFGDTTFTTLQWPDGSFRPFAVTAEEISAARLPAGHHRVVQSGYSIRTRLAEQNRALRESETNIEDDRALWKNTPKETRR